MTELSDPLRNEPRFRSIERARNRYGTARARSTCSLHGDRRLLKQPVLLRDDSGTRGQQRIAERSMRSSRSRAIPDKRRRVSRGIRR